VRGRELDRLLAISAANDIDTGDELLGLDERPVAEQRLPVADADRGGRPWARELTAQDMERGTSRCITAIFSGADLPSLPMKST
jgi:hypothetical protein